MEGSDYAQARGQSRQDLTSVVAITPSGGQDTKKQETVDM